MGSPYPRDSVLLGYSSLSREDIKIAVRAMVSVVDETAQPADRRQYRQEGYATLGACRSDGARRRDASDLCPVAAAAPRGEPAGGCIARPYVGAACMTGIRIMRARAPRDGVPSGRNGLNSASTPCTLELSPMSLFRPGLRTLTLAPFGSSFGHRPLCTSAIPAGTSGVRPWQWSSSRPCSLRSSTLSPSVMSRAVASLRVDQDARETSAEGQSCESFA